jgi:MFS family permease
MEAGKTDSAAERPVSTREFLTVFIAVAFPMFMSGIDQTLLATATPAISLELGALQDTSWIAVAYLLATVVIVPVYGRLGDAYGRRRVMMISISVFTLGALICAAAQSLPQLVAGRVVQGLGGGGLVTLAQSLIGEIAPPRQRFRFQVYITSTFTSASFCGPVVGGWLVTHAHWRWLFLIYPPMAAFALWRLTRLAASPTPPAKALSIDWGGIGLFAMAATSSLYWLTSVGHHFDLGSAISGMLVVMAGVFIAWLTRHERSHRDPFLPVDLLRDPAMFRLMATTALFSAAMWALIFFLPIYLQLGHRLSASESGVLMLPLTTGTVIGSIFAGKFAARTGETKITLVGGLALGTSSLLALALLPPSPLHVAGLGLLAGASFGGVMPVSQVVSQAIAGRARLGVAGALVTIFRFVGGAVGTAMTGALVYALLPGIDLRALMREANAANAQAVIHAFHFAFLLAAGLTGAAAWVASRMPKVRI